MPVSGSAVFESQSNAVVRIRKSCSILLLQNGAIIGAIADSTQFRHCRSRQNGAIIGAIGDSTRSICAFPQTSHQVAIKSKLPSRKEVLQILNAFSKASDDATNSLSFRHIEYSSFVIYCSYQNTLR
jgi:hypothetical protein